MKTSNHIYCTDVTKMLRNVRSQDYSIVSSLKLKFARTVKVIGEVMRTLHLVMIILLMIEIFLPFSI